MIKIRQDLWEWVAAPSSAEIGASDVTGTFEREAPWVDETDDEHTHFIGISDTEEGVAAEPHTEQSPPGMSTQADIEAEIRAYEQRFGMSSEDFMECWRNGTIEDTADTADWAVLFRYYLDYLAE